MGSNYPNNPNEANHPNSANYPNNQNNQFPQDEMINNAIILIKK